MTSPVRHSCAALRLVTTTGTPVRAIGPTHRRATTLHLVADDRQRRHLQRSIDFAIATRKHALQRLRRKGVSTRAVGCLLTLGLGLTAVWGATFPAAWGSAAPHRVVVAVMVLAAAALVATSLVTRAGAASAIAALTTCLAALERTRAALEADAALTVDGLHDLRRRYLDARQQCDVRHTHIDYLAARVSTGRSAVVWRWRVAYLADVYLVPALLLMPPVFAVVM